MRTKSFLHFFLLICLCLPLLTSCESQKTIVNGLDEKEANEIIVFLAKKGIPAYKAQVVEAGGGTGKGILFDIKVEEAEATRAMSILNEAGLPRRRGQSLLGIFSDVGLVPSEMTEKIRYQSGLGEQIASTIRKIDGVLDAEVQISFPEEDPLKPEESKGKIVASVYIKHSGVLDDPNTHLMTKIKRLVAASVTGLDYDNVTVIGDRARFSEIPIGLRDSVRQKELVSVWTVIIAKDSVTRFRVIFFTFSLLILILLISIGWIGFKVYPLLQRYGGIQSLLHLAPIVEQVPGDDEEDEEEDEEDDEEEEEDEDEEEEEEEDEKPPTNVT